MRLREHVLDLLTGPDIPVRNPVLRHLLFPLRLQSLALTDRLHDRKRKTFLKSLLDQIDHDIITRTDRSLNRCLALLDERLGIPQPYIRTMGQTRDTHKVRKILRLRVNQHLHREIRTELRNPERTKLTPADILRLDPQRIRALEQTHDLPRIQRDILDRIKSREVLQHTDHRRIIVPENIKL